MFKLSLPNEYAWPIRVDFTCADGRKQTQHFTATFPRLPQSELDELMRGMQSGDIDDATLADRVLVGWSDVQDASGDTLDYSPAAKAALLDTYPVRPSVLKAWFESLTGAKVKN